MWVNFRLRVKSELAFAEGSIVRVMELEVFSLGVFWV